MTRCITLYSAFEKFVEMRPVTAKNWLDDSITTNGYDLNSNDLAIILDLGMIIDSGKTKKYREMTLHQKFMLQSNLANLLEHPLSEIFLVMKHQLLLKYAYLNLFFYLIFVLCLTSLGVIGADMWACCGGANIANNSSLSMTSVLHCAPPRPDCHSLGLEYQGLDSIEKY